MLDVVHTGGKLFAGFSQRPRIETHAVHLHFCQDWHQGHLDVVEQILTLMFLQFRLQLVFQLKGDVGILAGIFIDEGGGEVAHGTLVLSFRTNQLVDVDGLVMQIHLSHVVHVVMQLGLNEVVGNHGVPQLTLQLDMIVAEHLQVILQILTNLQNMLVFIEWFENVDHLLSFFTFGRDRDVKCFMFLHGEAQTYQFSINSIGRSGLCI